MYVYIYTYNNNKYLYSALSCVTQSAVTHKKMQYYLKRYVFNPFLKSSTCSEHIYIYIYINTYNNTNEGSINQFL